MFEKRYLTPYIQNDLKNKMVFVGGPRQVGKTTLSRAWIAKPYSKPLYLNWDHRLDRQKIMQSEWSKENDLIIFDEIHKYPKWKNLIKGYYDVEKEDHDFLVTGSARLDVFRKKTDSLQGRYHYYRLHPFTLAEVQGNHHIPLPFSDPFEKVGPLEKKNQTLDLLLEFGGFPEPLLAQDKKALRRWHNEKIERLFREDINEVEKIRDLQSMKLLSDLMPKKVASLLSINNLANDIQVSHVAVSSWVSILESYYYHFRVYPYQSDRFRSLKKESKSYLWDWSEVSDEGARFENLIAMHLLKLAHLLYDSEGYRVNLYYLRDKDQREVDFLLTVDEKPWMAIEVKLSDQVVSNNLRYFQEKLNIPFAYQVVKTEGVRIQKKNIWVVSASDFLNHLV
jgi:predicted AAA+ superfamily ATPase